MTRIMQKITARASSSGTRLATARDLQQEDDEIRP